MQPFEEKLYPDIKRILINKFGVVSQAVKAQSFEKQSGALSVATGVIVQMNQKVGKTVWKILRNHQEFNEHNYQVFSSVKRSSKNENKTNVTNQSPMDSS